MLVAPRVQEVPTTASAAELIPGSDRWYAIHTRSRHERAVALQLVQKGMEVFLPEMSMPRRWSDRHKVIDVPLFPGYLFIHTVLSIGTRLAVLRVPGVVEFVGAQRWGTPIPEKQIEDVRFVLSQKIPYEPFPFLQQGRRVRICNGCLEGVEGILVGQRDQSLVLSIELLQRSLAIHIAGYDVVPVSTPESANGSRNPNLAKFPT